MSGVQRLASALASGGIEAPLIQVGFKFSLCQSATTAAPHRHQTQPIGRKNSFLCFSKGLNLVSGLDEPRLFRGVIRMAHPHVSTLRRRHSQPCFFTFLPSFAKTICFPR